MKGFIYLGFRYNEVSNETKLRSFQTFFLLSEGITPENVLIKVTLGHKV